MSPLAASALKTITFFDAQDVPLTLLEVKNNLIAEPNLSAPVLLSELEAALRTELAGRAQNQDGLYFLAGRQELANLRKTRYQISLMRFRKARRFLKGLRYVPYLRAVAISGSQALMSCQDQSDIDLFIITAPRRIWLARALVSLCFQIFGQRRHGPFIAGRFCLNHYVSQDAEIAKDLNLYTASEYANLIPVVGTGEFRKFWERSRWLGNYLLHAVPQGTNNFFKCEFGRTQKVLEIMLDFGIAPALNSLFGFFQKKRIQMQDYIFISDAELSFHPGSRGQTVLAKYQAKLAQFSRLDT